MCVWVHERIRCDTHSPKFTRTLPFKTKKKQKHLNYKPWHERRLGKERRNNDICNNANPPTIFNKTQYLFATKKGNVTHFTLTRRELHYTETERARGRWCKRRVDCLSLALTIAITKMRRRIVEEKTHTQTHNNNWLYQRCSRENVKYISVGKW